MSTVRQRKNVQKKSNVDTNSTQCPPTAVKTAGFKFWNLCNARNIIIALLILMISYYRFQNQRSIINKPSKRNEVNESEHDDNLIISEMITKRKVLPSTPILNKLYHRDIITSSSKSQEYFDQAMILSAAFNHDEAIRSLKYALMFDEKCVMCHWGIAYNYGMNINRVNDEQRLSVSVKHANLAKKYSEEIKQDQVSQDLVDAMIIRFSAGRTMEDDTTQFLMAFKDEMKKMSEKYSNDVDILVLYAESLMNTMPWDYYEREEDENGILQYKAKPDTLIVYKLLEKALDMKPDNLLALHLYIHIFEADMNAIKSNKRIEIVADKLFSLLNPIIDDIKMYGIGHLVHMPSHIYIRVGRFEDANIVNINAHTIAEQYYDYYNISDLFENYNQFYRVLYYCHRITFVMYSSMMNGQFKKADDYSSYLFDKCGFSTKHISFFFENASWKDKNLLRFGKFKELIDNYEKNDEWRNKYVAGGDNIYAPTQSAYTRAFAYASLKQCKKSMDIYQNEFLPGYNNQEIRDIMFVWQDAGGILEVAKSSFLARYADKCENDIEKSATLWTTAAKQYDILAYMEPPFWPINNRACLGQLYLDNGQYEKAKIAFKQDLDQIMLNGWALKGMILSLEKLDPNGEEIKLYQKQFDQAWQYADTQIDSACY